MTGSEIVAVARVTPVAGVARCGCVHHTQDGTPCEHDLGYAAGRAGLFLPETASDAFRVGWGQGTSALEASSNSHKSWGY